MIRFNDCLEFIELTEISFVSIDTSYVIVLAHFLMTRKFELIIATIGDLQEFISSRLSLVLF